MYLYAPFKFVKDSLYKRDAFAQGRIHARKTVGRGVERSIKVIILPLEIPSI